MGLSSLDLPYELKLIVPTNQRLTIPYQEKKKEHGISQ